MVDAGAKTMLKTDIVFLDREIKSRKQTFGIEIYDLMEELEDDSSLTVTEKESKIRAAFDAARKDIAVIQAKKECKMEEMSVLEAESGAAADPYGMHHHAATSSMSTPTHAAAASNIPPSSGVITNSHPADAKIVQS